MTDKVLVEINRLYSAQKIKFSIKDFFITIPPENCDRAGKKTFVRYFVQLSLTK